MRRILLIVILVVVCVSLSAQFAPYGQVRMNVWYELPDEDHAREDRLMLNYGLQGNSRFGADFRQGDLTSRVEFGFNGSNASPANPVSLRLAWARQNFGSWSLLVGQDAVMFNRATQTWGTDLGLDGYGAIDGGRHPQIRADFNIDRDRFYVALIRPNTANAPFGQQGISALIPAINLGYDVIRDNFRLMPAVMVQMYNYDDEYSNFKLGSTDRVDCQITSWILAITADFTFDALTLRVHGNYGQNTGNMGFAGRANFAAPNQVDGKTAHTASLGGYGMVGYRLNPIATVNAGFGFAMAQTSSGNHLFSHDDTRMAGYLNTVITAGGNGLQIVPEVGWVSEGTDFTDTDRGSVLYFGTQLRYSFR